MKKMKHLVAILLTVCLICSVTGLASAETCYETMKNIFSMAMEKANAETDMDIAELCVSLELEEKVVMLIYNPHSEDITLIGVNSSGKGEATSWDNLDSITGIRLLSSICEEWEFYEGLLDDGYELVLGIQSDEDDISIGILDAETAARFVIDTATILEGE